MLFRLLGVLLNVLCCSVHRPIIAVFNTRLSHGVYHHVYGWLDNGDLVSISMIRYFRPEKPISANRSSRGSWNTFPDYSRSVNFSFRRECKTASPTPGIIRFCSRWRFKLIESFTATKAQRCPSRIQLATVQHIIFRTSVPMASTAILSNASTGDSNTSFMAAAENIVFAKLRWLIHIHTPNFFAVVMFRWQCLQCELANYGTKSNWVARKLCGIKLLIKLRRF